MNRVCDESSALLCMVLSTGSGSAEDNEVVVWSVDGMRSELSMEPY